MCIYICIYICIPIYIDEVCARSQSHHSSMCAATDRFPQAINAARVLLPMASTLSQNSYGACIFCPAPSATTLFFSSLAA